MLDIEKKVVVFLAKQVFITVARFSDKLIMGLYFVEF